MTAQTLPVELDEEMRNLPAKVGWNMPSGLAIWFDPQLFDHCTRIAAKMADAAGFTPAHLVGKPSACLAVVDRAINWKLSPFAVAMCTYQTPGGQIGFMGKLIQAILENSGRIEGSPKYEHFGDWKKVEGKFELKGSARNADVKYPSPTWDRKDADGLGVVVRCTMKGEVQPREWELLLTNCFPLNSTLWATNPKRQICYTAIRAFADHQCPGLIMGVPWDQDDYSNMRTVEAVEEPPPPRPKLRAVEPAEAGHEDLDQRYRSTMGEPEPTSEAAAGSASTEDSGRSTSSAPETTSGKAAVPEVSAEIAALRKSVDEKMAQFSEHKALKNFFMTVDREAEQLRRRDGEYATGLYDKHWKRISKAKAGG